MRAQFLPRQHIVVLLSAFVIAATSNRDRSHAQQRVSTYVLNSSFEEGDKGWLLVTEKGVKGGRIVEEPDGNHALYSEGDTYWMASTDHRVFTQIGRAHV